MTGGEDMMTTNKGAARFDAVTIEQDNKHKEVKLGMMKLLSWKLWLGTASADVANLEQDDKG